MNKKTVDVAIVSANFNNGQYLREFIESVVDSSVWPEQLILVDDGSTDNSLEILSQMNFSKLEVVELTTNVGFGHALNEGIKRVRSKYILRVDPDDLVDRKRIEKQFNFLEENKDVSLVGSNALYFHSEDYSDTSTSNFPEGYNLIKSRYLAGEHGLMHGTVMGKTELFKKYRYNQETVPAEDYDIFSRMIRDGVIAENLPEKLTKVRIHKGSVSNVLPKSTIEKTFQIRDSIFNKKTSWIRLNATYYCMFYYRKYKYSQSLKRYIYLFLSVILRPDKLWGRLN